MRNLNCLFVLLISLSGLSLSAFYSCGKGESEQVERCLDRTSAAALRTCPEVTVTVVNEIKDAGVIVKQLTLKGQSHPMDTAGMNGEKECTDQKIDYNIILGATKTCFSGFFLSDRVPEDCSLEVMVDFVYMSGGQSGKKEVIFRYDLREALAGQFVSGPNPHIGITLVLVNTEDGGFDADWLATGL